jgi:NTE family protein
VPGIYPCITINGRRYYDGGIRSASNADLASGYETVLIVSVGGGPAASSDPRAELARQRLEDEIATLKTAGAKTVELLTPDEGARNAFGLNMMDARQNQGAAENGLRQGRELASKLREVCR